MIQYLKQVWANKEAILEGLKNYLFANGKIRFIAKKRRVICKICPYSSKNAKHIKMTEGKIYAVPFNHCTLCGCSLLIKPYSMESECPKKFWFSRKL